MKTSTASVKSDYFYVIMACLFPIIALVGFIPSYMAMNAGEFPIHWFAHIHGAIMSCWLLLYLIQGILAVRKQMLYHKQLGFITVGVGVLAWISMGITSARALYGYQPELDSFLFDVLLVQLYGMVAFGLFFVWGIMARKKAAYHKRLMFLATLVLCQAAIDRIPLLRNTMSPFIWLDLLLIPLFLYDLITIRKIHIISVIGLLVYAALQITVTFSFGSPGWHRFWYNLTHLNG